MPALNLNDFIPLFYLVRVLVLATAALLGLFVPYAYPKPSSALLSDRLYALTLRLPISSTPFLPTSKTVDHAVQDAVSHKLYPSKTLSRSVSRSGISASTYKKAATTCGLNQAPLLACTSATASSTGHASL